MSYKKHILDMKQAIERSIDAMNAAQNSYNAICDIVANDKSANMPSDAYMELMAISVEINQFSKSAKDELEILKNSIKKIEI